MISRELPNVPSYYEEILKALSIPFVCGDYSCKIFDPNCQEYEDFPGTEKIPTENMISAATVYYQQIAWPQLKKTLIDEAKQDFKKRFDEFSIDGISYCWTQDYDDLEAFLSPEYLKDDYFFFNLASYVNHDYFTGYCKYLVILKSAVHAGKLLTIQVPKFWAGLVIGRAGNTIKKISQQLSVRDIQVIESEEN